MENCCLSFLDFQVERPDDKICIQVTERLLLSCLEFLYATRQFIFCCCKRTEYL